MTKSCYCLTAALVVFCSVANFGYAETGRDVTIEELRHVLQYAATPEIIIESCKLFLKNNPLNGEAHYILAMAYKGMADFVVETAKDKEVYQKMSDEQFSIAKKLGHVPSAAIQ